MSREKTLSYQYDEIMKYQAVNNKLPQKLVMLCSGEICNNNMPSLHSYDDQLSEIIVNITKGINPNSVVFRNFVRYYVSMIAPSTYNDFLKKLKALDYTSKENIHFLASELIICAIKSPLSINGLTPQDDQNLKSVPEICADVAKHFSQFMIENESSTIIQFHDEITKICQQYFLDFVDMNKSMDENNEDTADNYKGFMTFMGLLYSRGVVNIKAVVSCIDTIKRAIYATKCDCLSHSTFGGHHNCCEHSDVQLTGSKTKNQTDNKLSKIICYYDCNKCTTPTEEKPLVTFRKQIECMNLHKGYEYLIKHVSRSLDMRSDDLLKSLMEKQISLGEITKIYNETTDLTPELETELKNATDARDNVLAILEKLCGFVDIIIKSHQEMINLNRCYISASLVRTKYVPPFKPHSILNHNEIGRNLNKLQDKLMPYSSNYDVRYVDAPLK